MKTRWKNPVDQEDLAKVLDRVRNRTREEWLEILAWRPAGYVEPEDGEEPNGHIDDVRPCSDPIPSTNPLFTPPLVTEIPHSSD